MLDFAGIHSSKAGGGVVAAVSRIDDSEVDRARQETKQWQHRHEGKSHVSLGTSRRSKRR